jgi:ribonuclease D
MLKYAREDTHYLLHIYDTLRKQLEEKALLHAV